MNGNQIILACLWDLCRFALFTPIVIIALVFLFLSTSPLFFIPLPFIIKYIKKTFATIAKVFIYFPVLIQI